jgi:hypothetical protein
VTTLGCSPSNPIRRAAKYIAKSFVFEMIILVCIVCSCGFLILSPPHADYPASWEFLVLEPSLIAFWTDVFLFIYTGEFVIRVLHQGLLWTHNSYFSSWINCIDFSVLVFMWLSRTGVLSEGILVECARLARALLPMRLIRYDSGKQKQLLGLCCKCVLLVLRLCAGFLCCFVFWTRTSCDMAGIAYHGGHMRSTSTHTATWQNIWQESRNFQRAFCKRILRHQSRLIRQVEAVPERIYIYIYIYTYIYIYIYIYTHARAHTLIYIHTHISVHTGIRILVDALIGTLPPFLFAVFLGCVTIIIFAVIGMHSFGGKLYRCSVPGTDLYREHDSEMAYIPGRAECSGTHMHGLYGYVAPRTWENAFYNFDTMYDATYTLFCVTMRKYVAIMYSCVDITSPHQSPLEGHSPANAVYFIVYLVVGTLFIMNLFVALIIDGFNACRGTSRNEVLYWRFCRQVAAFQPKFLRRALPRGAVSVFLRRVLTSYKYIVFSSSCVVINFGLMLADNAFAPWWYVRVLEWQNLGFFAIICLEIIAHAVAFGVPTCLTMDHWTKLDLTVALAAAAGYAVGAAHLSAFVKGLRMVRIIRLVKEAGPLRAIIDTIVRSVPQFVSVCALLFLVTAMSAVVQVYLFSAVKYGQRLGPTANFENWFRAMVTSYQILAGDDWHELVMDVSVQHPACTTRFDAAHVYGWTGQQYSFGDCGHRYARYFFLVHVFVIHAIVVNMFPAIIVDNFSFLADDVVAQDEESKHRDGVFVDAEDEHRGALPSTHNHPNHSNNINNNSTSGGANSSGSAAADRVAGKELSSLVLKRQGHAEDSDLSGVTVATLAPANTSVNGRSATNSLTRAPKNYWRAGSLAEDIAEMARVFQRYDAGTGHVSVNALRSLLREFKRPLGYRESDGSVCITPDDKASERLIRAEINVMVRLRREIAQIHEQEKAAKAARKKKRRFDMWSDPDEKEEEDEDVSRAPSAEEVEKPSADEQASGRYGPKSVAAAVALNMEMDLEDGARKHATNVQSRAATGFMSRMFFKSTAAQIQTQTQTQVGTADNTTNNKSDQKNKNSSTAPAVWMTKNGGKSKPRSALWSWMAENPYKRREIRGHPGHDYFSCGVSFSELTKIVLFWRVPEMVPDALRAARIQRCEEVALMAKVLSIVDLFRVLSAKRRGAQIARATKNLCAVRRWSQTDTQRKRRSNELLSKLNSLRKAIKSAERSADLQRAFAKGEAAANRGHAASETDTDEDNGKKKGKKQVLADHLGHLRIYTDLAVPVLMETEVVLTCVDKMPDRFLTHGHALSFCGVRPPKPVNGIETLRDFAIGHKVLLKFVDPVHAHYGTVVADLSECEWDGWVLRNTAKDSYFEPMTHVLDKSSGYPWVRLTFSIIGACACVRCAFRHACV